MIPEQVRLLIAAYVSGHASPRKRRAAVRILRESPEARKLYGELQWQSKKLNALAAPELPTDFADRIVACLPEPEPIIRPYASTPILANRRISYGRVAVALSVILAVGVGSFLIFGRQLEQLGRNQANRPETRPENSNPAKNVPEPAPFAANDPNAPGAIPHDRAIAKDGTTPGLPETLPGSVIKPTNDPLGNVPMPMPELVQVPPPRLLALPIRTLDSVEARQKLLQELEKATSHHVDLFCKDSSRAVERLQAACRERGVRLVIDAVAQDSVKRKFRAQYIVFCDELTAKDWVALLQQVGLADKRAEDKRAGDGVFDHVVILPLDGTDKKELTSIFGSDVTQQSPKSSDSPRKDGGTACLVAFSPWRTPSTSKEVRQFLDERRERSASSPAIVLVLRPLGN